jgi:heptosyltransferase I
MYGAGTPNPGTRVLVVRLSALGDIIHTLPAVASLKHSLPGSHLTWAVEARWACLLEGNPYVDEVLAFERGSLSGILAGVRSLRPPRFDLAIDFQGLIKSALVASLARPDRVFGFHKSQVRERAASLCYSDTALSRSAHVVDRNLDLAAAAGAAGIIRTFPLPAGVEEGELPERFVLASPLAGWGSKQWPLEYHGQLAALIERECGIPLVVAGPREAGEVFAKIPEARAHFCSVRGLIAATRRAAAVIGVDSGPLHIAAALEKPGVAIFGPTDPARNGPYGTSFRVLRVEQATTTYKRNAALDASMRQITPEMVFEALRAQMAGHAGKTAGGA